MRFLVDPGAVSLGPTEFGSWLALLVLCVLLPVAAVRQHRHLATRSMELTRPRIYGSGMVTHAGLLILTGLVVLEQDFALLPSYRPVAAHAAIGLLALALGLFPVVMTRGPAGLLARDRTRLIAPRTRGEFGMFYLLCLSAGFAEELAYRGALFTLLSHILLGSWWLAAIASAVSFGVVHLFQGWKAAGVAALIGLRDQLVVGLTGTLFVAIVVHVLHDAIAGTLIGVAAGRQEGKTLAIS